MQRTHIQTILKIFSMITLFLLMGVAPSAWSQSNGEDVAAKQELKLYAVEVTIGPNWDAAKAPHEQAFFKEHSMNLNELREAGHIAMGARYSDIGLLVFSAESIDQITEFMEKDPSISTGTFKFAVHPMNVFYPGLVQP